jgi:hypothetical protein
MLINTRVGKAVIAGFVFFAGKRIAEDVLRGVDYRLIVDLVGGIAFAFLIYGWLWWRDKRANKGTVPAQRS